MRCVRLLLPLFFLALSGIGTAQEREADLSDLRTALAAVLDEYDLPALAVALVDDAGPVWIDALGMADRDRGIPADAQSLFPIASTSKLFVGLAVLQLVARGELQLDDRLSELAPDVAFSNPWEATHPVRLVHLLEHTTGWDEQHYPEFARGAGPAARLAADVAFHPHSRTSRWPPGSRFAYNNIGPSVAAYVVERRTGMAFEDFVRDHLFEPLGMTTAGYHQSLEAAPRGVTLYAGQVAVPWQQRYMRPSGAISASAADMARLLRFFLGRGEIDGRRLLAAELLHRMETPISTEGARAGLELGYGLTSHTTVHGRWVFHGHDGGIDGAMSEFAYLPAAGRGHAIMLSSKHPRAFRRISRLVRDFQVSGLTPPPRRPAAQLDPEHRSIEGLYRVINPRLGKLAFLARYLGVRSLHFDGDALVLRGLLGGRERRFLPAADGLFRSVDSGAAALAIANDPLAGRVIHDVSDHAGRGSNAVLAPLPSWLGYGMTALELVWPAIVLANLLIASIWTLRLLWARLRAGPGRAREPALRLRLWPVLASLSMLGVFALLRVAAADYLGHLGEPTPISLGITALTLLFGLFAILGVVSVLACVRRRRLRKHWFMAGCAITHGFMAAHMSSFGVIGIRFWT